MRSKRILTFKIPLISGQLCTACSSLKENSFTSWPLGHQTNSRCEAFLPIRVRRSVQIRRSVQTCWTLPQYLFTSNCPPICASVRICVLDSVQISAHFKLCANLCKAFPDESVFSKSFCLEIFVFANLFLQNSIIKNLFLQNLSRWRWEAGGFPANLPYFFPISSLQPPLWDHFFSFLFCGSTFFILLIKFMLTSNRYQSSLSVFSAANWTDFCLFCPFCVDHHHP